MKSLIRYCLIFLLSIVSCTPELEPNTRILVQGLVLNSEGEGLFGLPVANYSGISTSNSSSFVNEGQLLGNGLTKSDGSFNLTSLSNRGNDFFVSITGGQEFTDYRYASVSEASSLPNSILNIGTVYLKRKAVVNYAITRLSGSGNTISYTFSFQNPECKETYQDGIISLDLSDCFSERPLNGSLNDNNSDVSRQFTTVLGSTVTFSYSINDEPMISETFSVEQTNFSYEFNY